jgi:hypothetical protein
MAITYIGSTSRPGDGGAQAGSVTSALSIAALGVTTGDLVVVIAHYRGNATLQPEAQMAGQTWNSLTQFNDTGSLCAVRVFWARWDNATYNGNDPNFEVISGGSTIAFTTVGHVFRPTSGSNTWAVDNALSNASYAAPSTPFTVSITGVTPTHASSVAIAGWFSEDDNTWGTLSGTGWSVLGDAQYRNTTGNDMSSSYAYKIQSSAAATGSVSKNQATLGGDAGATFIISFYEASSGAYTLPITTASFTQTNTAVGLLMGRSLTLSTSSFTYTPKTLNLLHGYRVVLSPAAYTLTNISVGLSAARRSAISPLALSSTAQSVGLLAGKRLAITSAAYTLTNQSNALTIQRRIALTTGSYTVTRLPIGLLATRRLPVATASYTLTLVNVGLNFGFRLSINPASFAVTTVAAGLRAARTIPVSAVSFTVTTILAALKSNRLLPVSPATFSLSLNNIGLLYGSIENYSLQINALALAITRNQVGLLANRTMPVNKASFDLAYLNAQLVTGRRLAISTAPLIIQWQNVAQLLARIFNIGTVSYTLNGNDVSFSISTVNANQVIQLISHINGSVAGQSNISITSNNSSNIGSLIDSESDINDQQQLNSNIITTN